MRTLKSIVAVIVGLAAAALLSVGADSLLYATGVFGPSGVKDAPVPIVVLVLSYRFLLNALGCYLAARLAPGKPMRHALILGAIGCIGAIAGAILLWNEAPPFYHVALIATALPAAWIGGRWGITKTSGQHDR